MDRTARPAAPASPLAGGAPPSGRPPAQRTCIGCRQRTDRSGLLRLVVVRSPGVVPLGVSAVVVPDPWCRLPGRGAWVHPRTGCLDVAEKRRAVPRALRVQGPVDLDPVRSHLAAAPAHGQSDEYDQSHQYDQRDENDQQGRTTRTTERASTTRRRKQG